MQKPGVLARMADSDQLPSESSRRNRVDSAAPEPGSPGGLGPEEDPGPSSQPVHGMPDAQRRQHDSGEIGQQPPEGHHHAPGRRGGILLGPPERRSRRPASGYPAPGSPEGQKVRPRAQPLAEIVRERSDVKPAEHSNVSVTVHR